MPAVQASGERRTHANQRPSAVEQWPPAAITDPNVHPPDIQRPPVVTTDGKLHCRADQQHPSAIQRPPKASDGRHCPAKQRHSGAEQRTPAANTDAKRDLQPNVSSRPPSTPTASAAHSSNSSRTAPKQTPNVDPRKSLRLTTAQGGGERRRYASASSLAANTGSERPRPAEQRTHAGNVSCRITAMPATSAARRATPAATSRKSRQRASVLRQKAEQRHPIDKQWRPTASTDAKSHPGAITSGQLLKNNRRQAPPRRHTVATRGQRTEPHPAHTGSEAHPPANPNSRLPPLRAASATPQPAPASASRQHQQ